MSRLLRFLCVLLFFGCTKAQQEKIASNLLIDLITNGQWKVTSYIKGSTDITTAFSPYIFQFKKDYTVDAIESGAVSNTGTWNGDIVTRSVTANFSHPDSTLVLLNGTWQITHSSTTYVIAGQANNGEACVLRLDKQ